MSGLLSNLARRILRKADGSADDPLAIVRAGCIEPALPVSRPHAPPIALRYFMGVRNIGDLMSPIAVQYATGHPTRWRRRITGPHLLGLGSILSWSTASSHVWGSGILHPSGDIGGVRPERVWALRGKLTQARLQRELGGLRDMPLGDPGYLVGRALGTLLERPAPTHRLGIVAHYAHRDHPAIARWRGENGVVVLDVHEPEPAFFARMRACETIASSSLHGLVFAEAFGIPNVWVDLARASDNRTFKYRDWFSLAARPQAAPLTVGPQMRVRDVVAATALHEFQIDEPALRTAIPSRALEEMSEPGLLARRTRHFLVCRRQPLPIFLATRNRSRLRDLSAAYRAQSRAVEIIVVDRSGDTGYAERVRRFIKRHFRQWGEPARFAVATDDVDLSIAAPDALALYDELLDRFPDAACVGPMFRLSHVPRDHPAFARILNAELACRQQPPSWSETSFGRVGLTRMDRLDGFALHRANVTYRGPTAGLRVHHPFEARNIDWEMPRNDAEPAGALRFDSYYAVERGPDGALSVVAKSLI